MFSAPILQARNSWKQVFQKMFCNYKFMLNLFSTHVFLVHIKIQPLSFFHIRCVFGAKNSLFGRVCSALFSFTHPLRCLLLSNITCCGLTRISLSLIPCILGVVIDYQTHNTTVSNWSWFATSHPVMSSNIVRCSARNCHLISVHKKLAKHHFWYL